MAIQVLENSIINKIAAGEVVERPASVVKELVENAIDAGAKAITVEIGDGGISLIRVTDNGCGIPSEDVRAAFMRHATSKLMEIEDLETLLTLGFRGEALSSIASVSQVELITKTPDAITGVRLEIHGGKAVSEQEIGCADGTTFIMRNLFYNTPARRKFLKKPASESGYIADIIHKLALGRPDIAFKYINNSSTLVQTNGNGDVKTAVFQVYGKDVAQKLLKVSIEDGEYKLSGFIGKPEVARGNRSYENFFINGRYIKSGLIASAVEEAYKTRLMVGRFPLFVLNLTTSPANVDINVHPTKLEARFSNEDWLFQFVRRGVEEAFQDEVLIPRIEAGGMKPQKVSSGQDRPHFSQTAEIKPYELAESPKNFLAQNVQIGYNDTEGISGTKTLPIEVQGDTEEEFAVREGNIGYITIQEDMPNLLAGLAQNADSAGAIVPLSGHKENLTGDIHKSAQAAANGNQDTDSMPFFKQYTIIGQLFHTYWLIEQDHSLYLVDQHAAHEKVLYESLVAAFRQGEIASQRLISPMAVRLGQRECQIVRDNWDLLHEFGFEIEEFGKDTYALRAVPQIFSNPSDTRFFTDMVDRLSQTDTSVDNLYETKLDTIATMSCKAAVKGNDRLNYIEAKALIDQVLALHNPFTCPHGRPTIVEITQKEIEKMFKRIV